MHRGRVIDEAADYKVVDCAECGYIHIDPVPGPEELKEVYSEEYYTEEKPDYIERNREDLGWWEVVYNERLDVFEENLPPERRRLLDIGTGPGHFLKRASERGWSCVGVEPSHQAARYAREDLGLDVREAFLDDDTVRELGGGFDAVHLSEVLEHLPDPAGTLDKARGLLSEGGMVCCVVPNDYSPVQKLLREKLDYQPYWLAPPHHINYFTFESLTSLMERCGFRVVEKTSMFPMDFFLLMGENYVGDDRVGRHCHAKRKRLEEMLSGPEMAEFKKDWYRLMARYGIGREMVAFGVKEGK